VTAGDLAVRPLVVGVIAGESSGDQLGAGLMRSLQVLAGRPIRYVGIGGPLMEAEGLQSLFPMSDIAVNGVFPVLRRLPTLLRRMADAAQGIAAATPDIVVHIDAQDFNKRVAAKLKRLIPETPLICYVSPTVWAWREGRARKIARIYDHLLAVLPFEPEVHARLGGPPTTYVGHPLIDRLADFTPSPHETELRATEPWRVLILPGSRISEINRLLPVFGDAAAALARMRPGVEFILPAVPHLRDRIAAAVESWPVKPTIVAGEAAKLAAFRTARAAIACSGTVTLELAMAGVPTVLAYKVSMLEREVGRIIIKARFAALPSLIAGRRLLPEYLSIGWTGETLAGDIAPLLEEGAARQAQLDGFAEVRRKMAEGVENPSRRAADVVLETLARARAKPAGGNGRS
jgi:lipid-A-disaccharide synthase